jgi:hypothetical protein
MCLEMFLETGMNICDFRKSKLHVKALGRMLAGEKAGGGCRPVCFQ